MQNTARNTLKKPDLADPALISDINDNMNIIDAAIAKCNFTATTDPTVNDDGLDGYSTGSIWINWTLNTIFILKNNATGAAVWRQIWPALATDINASAPFLIPQATNSNGTIRYIGLGNYLRLGSMVKGAYSYISHNAILTTSSDTLGNKFSPQYSPGQGIIQLGGYDGNLSFYGIDWNSSAEDKIFPNDFTLILTLLYNGYVGIGKTPSEALDILGNINISNNAYVGNRLGIGLNNPAERLDVLGNINTVGNVYVSDKLGIGLNNPSYNLHIQGTFGLDGTCSNIGESTFRFRRIYETTANANNTHNLTYMSPYISIANGITNSGYLRGMFIEILRNRVGDDGTIGTQANIQGLLITYGHYNNAAINPITTNVYGLYLSPYYRSGTITNMYDIYLAADQTGGTVTNRYGIYQANSALNYFTGAIYCVGNISALSFTDRTKGYTKNNALDEIAKIKNDKDGLIDHNSLPDFVKTEKCKHNNEKNIDEVVVERDLGNMISVLTVGIQELIKQNEELKNRLTILEEKMKITKKQ